MTALLEALSTHATHTVRAAHAALATHTAHAAVTPGATSGKAVGYPSVFLLVVLGSLVPVIPTGAVVSGAAAVAFHDTSPVSLALVFVTGTVAAYVGDLALYWLGARGVRSKKGSRWLARLRERASAEQLATARRRLDEHGMAVLTLSRLVPAGRIPVMVACLLAGMPVRRFARGDLPACVAWAIAYQLIGILGGSLFAKPWQGVAVAVGLTVLISVAPPLVKRLRRGTGGQASQEAGDASGAGPETGTDAGAPA
jgi:membrane protein DedA with SNARE-associated domain